MTLGLTHLSHPDPAVLSYLTLVTSSLSFPAVSEQDQAFISSHLAWCLCPLTLVFSLSFLLSSLEILSPELLFLYIDLILSLASSYTFDDAFSYRITSKLLSRAPLPSKDCQSRACLSCYFCVILHRSCKILREETGQRISFSTNSFMPLGEDTVLELYKGSYISKMGVSPSFSWRTLVSYSLAGSDNDTKEVLKVGRRKSPMYSFT